MTLPKVVFVTKYKDSDGKAYLSAETDVAGLFNDDGPIVVGKYVLQSTRKVRKTVVPA